MRKIMIYACLLFAVTGCMKDLGNYEYKTLNKISISGIDTLYSIEQLDTLKMNPKFSFSQGNAEDLSYEWRINYKVVSDQLTLNKPIGVDFGTWPASLTVTNKANGLKYFFDFKVEILNPYGSGLIVLSEKDDGSSMLSFQNRGSKARVFKEDIFSFVNPEFGDLGKKPVQLFYDESSKTNPKLYVISQEGDKKITIIAGKTMKYLGAINEHKVVGEYNGSFAPTYMHYSFGGSGIVSEGKLFIYNAARSEALSRPVEGDYSLANYITTHASFSASYWIGYDKGKNKFITFSPVNNPYDYSKIEPYIFKNVSTENMKFVAGSEYGGVDQNNQPAIPTKKKLIFFSEDNLHFFEMIIQRGDAIPGTGRVKPNITLKKDMSVSGIGNDKSVCLLGQKTSYWFIATQNKIYRIYANGGNAELWYTLDRGTVKAMKIDSNEETLFVAASVGGAGKKSGDILVLDAITKNKLIEPVYRDACKEPVDLIIK